MSIKGKSVAGPPMSPTKYYDKSGAFKGLVDESISAQGLPNFVSCVPNNSRLARHHVLLITNWPHRIQGFGRVSRRASWWPAGAHLFSDWNDARHAKYMEVTDNCSRDPRRCCGSVAIRTCVRRCFLSLSRRPFWARWREFNASPDGASHSTNVGVDAAARVLGSTGNSNERVVGGVGCTSGCSRHVQDFCTSPRAVSSTPARSRASSIAAGDCGAGRARRRFTPTPLLLRDEKAVRRSCLHWAFHRLKDNSCPTWAQQGNPSRQRGSSRSLGLHTCERLRRRVR